MRGATGSGAGDKGDTGEQGLQGNTGPSGGEKGDTGIGATGAGATGIGATGVGIEDPPIRIDTVNFRVGVNQGAPDRGLETLDDTDPPFRITHTAGSVYTDFQTNAQGYLDVMPTGGIVNLVGQSAVSVYLSSDQSISSGVDELVEFDSQIYDVQGEFSTVSHEFIPYASGIYSVKVNIRFEGATHGDGLEVKVLVNDSKVLGRDANQNTTSPQGLLLSADIPLNALDVVTIEASNNNSNDVIDGGSDDTWMQITKLH